MLGERELLRQEVQKELAAAADAELGPKFLHIVVKLADIESVYFNTASGRSLKFDQTTEQRPRSALTAALANSPRKENAPSANNRCACNLALACMLLDAHIRMQHIFSVEHVQACVHARPHPGQGPVTFMHFPADALPWCRFVKETFHGFGIYKLP